MELIPCCEHCGCLPDEREGHDDSCRYGCNDPKPGGIITTNAIGTGGLKKPTKKGFK